VKGRLSALFSPVRYRDFRYLWGAEIFSQLGDWAGRLALSVVVAERTGSTFLTALVTAVSVLPYIGLGQLLAAYANRFPRIRTIIVCDVGRAIIFALLIIEMPIWLMLVLAFIAGCMTPPFEAVRNSLTPFTVPRERYGDAIALVSITFDSSVLFGYAVGGALIAAVGAQTALFMNASSFIISALLLLRIPSAHRNPIEGPPVRVRDGWHSLVDDPFVRRFFTAFMWVGACAVVGESIVALYAIDELHREAAVSGLLAAAIPLGGIIGTVLGRSHGDHSAKLRVASVVALVGSVIGVAVFAVGPSMPGILIGFAAIGALNASRVPANEVAVVRLDDRVRVPTFAVLNGFLLGSQAIAAALGGLIARSIGVRETILLSLVISGIVGIWGSVRPPHEIRHRVGTTTTTPP